MSVWNVKYWLESVRVCGTYTDSKAQKVSGRYCNPNFIYKVQRDQNLKWLLYKKSQHKIFNIPDDYTWLYDSLDKTAYGMHLSKYLFTQCS